MGFDTERSVPAASIAVKLTRKDWELTAQQMKVVGFMWKGLTRHEIARKMHLSAGAVGFHITRIYRKFGIRTRRHRDTQRREFHKIVGFWSPKGHEVIG